MGMELDPICVVECDDCGSSIVSDPELISVFINFGGETLGATRCGYCDRPVVCEIDPELAKVMVADGVRIFSWIEGGEVSIDHIGVQ